MRRISASLLTLSFALIITISGPQPVKAADANPTSAANLTSAEQQWGQWRGPYATGAASKHANPPLEWSPEKNIRWKTSLPGRGHSSPVVWGNRIYLTAAAPIGEAFKPIHDNAPGSHDNLPVTHKHEFIVLAVARDTGKIVWRRRVHEAIPHEGSHYTGSLASASPMTDGRRVYAYFGSYGLYALELDGTIAWKRKLGVMNTKHAHGEGSSPVLSDNIIVINWDHEGQSFVVAVNATDGKQVWKRQRKEVTSWATPIVVEVEGRKQVIVSGTSRVRAYDLKSGEIIWECGGLSANIVASPVSAEGMLIAASSYEKKALLGIKLKGATGDITATDQVIWSRRRSTPYVPSPLLFGDSVYYLSHYQGVLSRVQFKTGLEPLGPFRLGPIRNVYASPVAANDRVYVLDRSGMMVVISHSNDPELLAANRLNDTFNASPAIVDNQMILRGEKYLYLLANDRGTE